MQGGSLVFVYGTLKRGFYNHQFLSACVPPCSARFVALARTKGAFHLSVGGDWQIPYLHAVDDDSVPTRVISGEVYDVNDAMLAELDRIEGVPHHYHRRSVSVVAAQDGAELGSCFVYVKTEPDSALLTASPLDSYSLEVHRAYVPPPMRAGKDDSWRAHKRRVEEIFSRDPSHAQTPASQLVYSSTIWKAFIEGLARQPEKLHVVDVGCGSRVPGILSLLRHFGPDSRVSITALEANAEVLDLARGKLAEDSSRALADKVSFQHMDLVECGPALPIREAAGVVCLNVLCFVPEDLFFHAFRTLAVLLRPQGLLITDKPPGTSSERWNRFVDDCNLSERLQVNGVFLLEQQG